MKIENGLITAENGKYIKHKNRKDYALSMMVLKSETIEDFEEVDSIPEPEEGESFDYEERVNSLIRERYSESQEFALLRQRDSKTSEFEAYNAYCEECKARAREEMNNNVVEQTR